MSSQGASGAPSSTDVAVVSESWVLELARRQRMNTDIRKNIFCVIMTSEVQYTFPDHMLSTHFSVPS